MPQGDVGFVGLGIMGRHMVRNLFLVVEKFGYSRDALTIEESS